MVSLQGARLGSIGRPWNLNDRSASYQTDCTTSPAVTCRRQNVTEFWSFLLSSRAAINIAASLSLSLSVSRRLDGWSSGVEALECGARIASVAFCKEIKRSHRAERRNDGRPFCIGGWRPRSNRSTPHRTGQPDRVGSGSFHRVWTGSTGRRGPLRSIESVFSLISSGHHGYGLINNWPPNGVPAFACPRSTIGLPWISFRFTAFRRLGFWGRGAILSR